MGIVPTFQGAHDHPATSLSGQSGQSFWGFVQQDQREREKERRSGSGGAAWWIVLGSVGKMGQLQNARGEAGEKGKISEAAL